MCLMPRQVQSNKREYCIYRPQCYTVGRNKQLNLWGRRRQIMASSESNKMNDTWNGKREEIHAQTSKGYLAGLIVVALLIIILALSFFR
jgi:hypothetical protein